MLWPFAHVGHADVVIRGHGGSGHSQVLVTETLSESEHRPFKNQSLKCDLIGCAVVQYGPESSSPTRCLMKLRRRRHFLLTLRSQVLLVEAGIFGGLSMVQASRDELAKPHRSGPNDCAV